MRKALCFGGLALLIVVFFASVALAQDQSCSAPAAKSSQLSKEQITDIAKKAAVDKGMVLDAVDVVYDEGNQKWAEFVALVEESPADPNKGNLPGGIQETKKYQAVFLDVRDSDADAWAFIDPDTGDVLAFYMEK